MERITSGIGVEANNDDVASASIGRSIAQQVKTLIIRVCVAM